MIKSPEPAVAPPVSKADHGKLSEIQVLRGVSIVSVLFCHLSITPTLLEWSPSKITMPLYLGVEIFFVISGYVIANSLFRDQFSGLRFFIKRAFRLLPAMFVFLAISFALNVCFQRSDYSDDMKALFSVPQGVFLKQALAILGGYFVLLGGPASYCNGAMWSLSVEDQFYAALTVLCLLSGCLGASKAKAAALLTFAASLLMYLSIMTVRVCLLFGIEAQGKAPAMLMYFVNRNFDFLAIGILLAFAEPRIRTKLRKSFQDCGQFLAPFLLMLPFGLGALAEPIITPAPAPILHGLLMPFAGLSFALLVLLAANGMALPVTRGPIHKTFAYLGDRSYTIYVFHYLAFALAWMLIYRFCPSAFSNAIAYGCCQVIFSFAIMLPLCELIYKTVELPLARLGRKLAASVGGSKPDEIALHLAIDQQGSEPALPAAELRTRGKAA